MVELPDGDVGASYEFNYTLWTANTRVQLCNVPWNSDYRDIVKFRDRTALDTYLQDRTGTTLRIEDATPARVGQPVDVDIPFNVAYRYNYLRVHNPAQPIAGDIGRTYYYFVTDVVHIAPNTTRLFIQLDVWQTFGFDVKFGNCYIEQGHIGIANRNSFDEYGREYLTTPEGLDIGGEYQVVEWFSRTIATGRVGEGVNPTYSIMVVSTVDFTKEPGTVDAPELSSAKGTLGENLPNGADYYIFDSLNDFQAFMVKYQDKPWITQGIMSITAIPPVGEYGLDTRSTVVDGVSIVEVEKGSMRNKRVDLAENWRDRAASNIPTRYRHLKKFLTYPYMVCELTASTGTPIIIKPESWFNADASIIELPHFMSSGARIMFAPYQYNGGTVAPITDSNGVYHDGGEWLDFTTGILNFPSFSVVNNGYMQYLAANTNSIAYSQQAADWGQQKALTGNQLAYDQASQNMATTQEMNRLGVNAQSAHTNLANEMAMANAGAGMLGLAGGLATGGIGAGLGAANAAGSLMNMTLGTVQRNQSLGINTGLANAQTATGVGNAGYMRDTNKSFADYAARGDYANQIAGIQAKLQDARMIQPTTSGQIGGDAFNLARYKWGYDLKVKLLGPAALAAVGEFWLRYGYQVNRFGRMPASLQCMTKFTYWKLRETYITSSECPETFKQAIRGIFEKGVTVWSNPNDIGTIDNADNDTLSGITL